MEIYKMNKLREAQDEASRDIVLQNGIMTGLEESNFSDFFSNEVVVHDADNIEINNTYLAKDINELTEYVVKYGMEPFSQEREYFQLQLGDYEFAEKGYQYMLTHFMTRDVVQHFNFSALELRGYLKFYEGKRVCMAFSVLADVIDINLHLTAKFGWVARYDKDPNWCFLANIGSASAYMFISSYVENRNCNAEHMHYTQVVYPTEMFRIHRTFPSKDMKSAYSAIPVRPFMTIIMEQIQLGSKLYVLDTESALSQISHCDDWNIQSFDGQEYNGTDNISLCECVKKLLPAIFFVKGQSKEQVLLSSVLPKLCYSGEYLVGLWDVDPYLREHWVKEKKPHRAVNGVNLIKERMSVILALYMVPLPRRTNYPSIGRRQISLMYSGKPNQVRFVGRARMRKVPTTVLDETQDMYNPPNYDHFRKKPGQIVEIDIVGKTNLRVPVFIVKSPVSVLAYSRSRRIPELEVYHKIMLRPNQYQMERVGAIYYFCSAWVEGILGKVKSKFFFMNRSVLQMRSRVIEQFQHTVLKNFVFAKIYEEEINDLPYRRRSEAQKIGKWRYDREEDLNSYYRDEDTEWKKGDLLKDVGQVHLELIDYEWMKKKVSEYDESVEKQLAALSITEEKPIKVKESNSFSQILEDSYMSNLKRTLVPVEPS